MAQPPKRPTTRRPRDGAAPRRATTRKTAAPVADAGEAPAKPKRTRAAKAVPAAAPAAAAVATPPSSPAPASGKPTPPRRGRGRPAPSVASKPKPATKRPAVTEPKARDGKGRFGAGRVPRAVALGVGGAVIAGIGLGTALLRGWVKVPRAPFGKKAAAGKPVATDTEFSATIEEVDALRPISED